MREKQHGHWYYNAVGGEFNPDDYFGFIYRVTVLLTGEQYIGKKQFHRMNKSGTKRLGPSNWQKYKTSSDAIHKLLEEYPMECFHFEIILLCKTKAVMSYAESNILHKLDALIQVDSKWGLPKYLNKSINAVRWITKDYPVFEVDQLLRLYLTYLPIDPNET